MRRFEFREDNSSKFWEIAREGTSVTVRFGRIGTNGQVQTKSFDSEKKAEAEHDKLVKEKTKKGYSEVTEADGDAKKSEPAKADSETDAAAAPPPAEPVKPAAPRKAKAKPESQPGAGDGWVDAGNGYSLELDDGKLIARNAAGKKLASVPKELKQSDAADRLLAVQEWLAQHERECLATVEQWMLRSLPVPRAVLASVWPDTAWRTLLENAVVSASRDEEAPDPERTGFLRDVHESKGLGIVNLDGETVWLDAAHVRIPHPILVGELDDLRSLATELALTQTLPQLFREVFTRPADLRAGANQIDAFRGGQFKQLIHANALCRRLGYRVSGGAAMCRVWESGRVYEARYFIGSEDPQSETWTDELYWVDDRERRVNVADVAPVAFSEGMRMASAIYAGRVIEKEQA
jgi:predicted DNA-binding WGR domain protein